VLSPAAPEPHVLVAFNGQSLHKFGPGVRPGGLVLYDSSVVPEAPPFSGVRVIGIPCTQIAAGLGAPRAKNLVALGALQAATQILPEESFLTALREAFERGGRLLPLNQEAFRRGANACHDLMATSKERSA
jgi:Pyruvate/2-oxoacid:ferredoxin oxidoreductase gamma subunit